MVIDVTVKLDEHCFQRHGGYFVNRVFSNDIPCRPNSRRSVRKLLVVNYFVTLLGSFDNLINQHAA